MITEPWPVILDVFGFFTNVTYAVFQIVVIDEDFDGTQAPLRRHPGGTEAAQRKKGNLILSNR